MKYQKMHDAYLLILQEAEDLKKQANESRQTLADLQAKYRDTRFTDVSKFRNLSVSSWLAGHRAINTPLTPLTFDSDRYVASKQVAEALEVFDYYSNECVAYARLLAEANELLTPVFKREAKHAKTK